MKDIKEVSISQINFDDKTFVFRHSFDVSELENSIRFEGLLHPPILLLQNNGSYTIVSGYRRLLALKKLDEKNAPSLVYKTGELAREDLLKIAIAENTKRQSLKPIEIAEALLRIKEELKLSNNELASQFGDTFGIGSNSESVERYLKLNLFDPGTKDFLAQSPVKNLEFTLAGVESAADRRELIDFVKTNDKVNAGQINKIAAAAQKISDKNHTKGLKQVFQDDSLKQILDNEDLKGSKKINAFLAQMEQIADPEAAGKQKRFDELVKKLSDELFAKAPELAKAVHVRRNDAKGSGLKVTIDAQTARQLLDIFVVMHEARNSIISPLFKTI